MLHSSLAAEASNEYRNITVMTSLLHQPPTIQYIGCCAQHRQLATTTTDVWSDTDEQKCRQAA